MQRKFLTAAATVLFSAAPAAAHHSLTLYSRSTSFTIEGTVDYYRWANPHVRIGVKTITPEGDIKYWDIESGSVGALSSAGFTRRTLAVGDKVSVSFYPRKDGVPSGFLISVTAADGRKYDPSRKRQPTGGRRIEL